MEGGVHIEGLAQQSPTTPYNVIRHYPTAQATLYGNPHRGKYSIMQWPSSNPKRRRSMQWPHSLFWLGTISFLLWNPLLSDAASSVSECNDECRWGHLGASGIADLLRPLQNDQAALCKDYAARVAGHTALLNCGHVEIAAAVEACQFGAVPSHCTRHQNAAVAVMVVSHVASIAVWFPLARMFVLSSRNV